MQALLDAIELRFLADKDLLRRARAMFFHEDGIVHHGAPYVDVVITDQKDELDTFDADVETVSLDMNIITTDMIGKVALGIKADIMRVYDDARFSTLDHSMVSMHRISAPGPSRSPGAAYDARVQYTAHVTMAALSPAVRGR